jgi:GINS complex subunit 3
LAEEVENRIERVLSDDAALLKIRRYLKTFHATARDMRAYYDVNDFFTYYDVNDFLAREHAVEVEFASGASTIAPEVLGTRATRDSNGRADVPKEHRALVPLWWLDGEMANDVWVCSTPAAFKDDVFDRLKAQDGARITDLRTVCESYFGFARATLDALERDADGDEDAMEPVKKLKKKVNDAFERRWREVLVDACGKMGDDDATERVLTREERRIWDAGRRLLPSRRHKKRLKTGVAKMARFERAN